MKMRELLEKQERITTQFQGRLRRALKEAFENGPSRQKLKKQIREQIPEALTKRSIKLGMEWLKK